MCPTSKKTIQLNISFNIFRDTMDICSNVCFVCLVSVCLPGYTSIHPFMGLYACQSVQLFSFILLTSMTPVSFHSLLSIDYFFRFSVCVYRHVYLTNCGLLLIDPPAIIWYIHPLDGPTTKFTLLMYRF